VAEDLDAVGGQSIQVDGSEENRDIIPIEKQSCSTRTGLCFCMHFLKITRTYAMYATLMVDPPGTMCE
jgi:hypothetical protein